MSANYYTIHVDSKIKEQYMVFIDKRANHYTTHVKCAVKSLLFAFYLHNLVVITLAYKSTSPYLFNIISTFPCFPQQQQSKRRRTICALF